MGFCEDRHSHEKSIKDLLSYVLANQFGPSAFFILRLFFSLSISYKMVMDFSKRSVNFYPVLINYREVVLFGGAL